jgi:hypothetical protein
MQIEFTVSGLKTRQRRRPEPVRPDCSVSPALRSIVLAFQIEQAVKEGRARDYADVARQIGMTRARVSQIMRLLRLPTNLLESVLLADPKQFAKLTERQLRSYATNPVPIPGLEELEPRRSHG